MAQRFSSNRMSAGSLDDDDPFYSAPSSRVASRHASLMPAPRNLQDETNLSTLTSEPLVSICQPGGAFSVAAPENQSLEPKRALKPRWTIPFTTRHDHNPKHHHFCPRPISRRFHKTFHSTSKSIPLLQPLADELDAERSNFTTPLVSSPGPMGRWSSAYNEDLRSGKSPSLIESPFDPINISRQGTDSIVSNIRAYLSTRRHNDCSPQPGTIPSANENRPLSWRFRTSGNAHRGSYTRATEASTDSYLVTTNDIAAVMDIVIAGIRRIHSEGSTVRCLSMLLPKEALPKPILNVKAIIPMSPVVADPATTISSVQPSFSLAGGSAHHTHYLDAPRTTFISRQSITEVT
ncbi:hypothetical protein F4819DRAFT_385544 [Hypoxylon fuscum]|nr:hypothetical protein F4819DRAFT_385544 [Hypoxylon fuscum]